MGIYIKGMDMPTTHEVVVHILPDGTASIHDIAYTQTKETVAVEVPKHGDLIDRGVAEESLLNGLIHFGYHLLALDCISERNVPTVIEEE